MLPPGAGLFVETGDRPGEAEARNGVVPILLAAGQPGQARAEHPPPSRWPAR